MTRPLALLWMALALPSCVTQATYELERTRVASLRAELAKGEQRISTLEEQVQELSSGGERLRLERKSLAEERLDLIAKLEATRTQNHDLQALLDARQKQVREREAELKEVGSTYRRLVDQLEGEVASGQVEIDRLQGRIEVRASNRVLFDSGSAELEPSGREVLRKLASEIRSLQDQRIRVEGHSDSVPIRTERFPSNWELSSARAASVVRFLEEQGVEAARLEAVGRADTAPLASNDTPEGRARNRRISILLVPAGE